MESSSGGLMPALLKQMSMPPNLVDTASYSASTSAADVTSTLTNMPSTDSATAVPAASSRSTTATFAPSAAERSAGPRPMPPAPPVITATLPARRWAYGRLSLIALLVGSIYWGRNCTAYVGI